MLLELRNRRPLLKNPGTLGLSRNEIEHDVEGTMMMLDPRGGKRSDDGISHEERLSSIDDAFESRPSLDEERKVLAQRTDQNGHPEFRVSAVAVYE